jgi:hypothetical protein
MNGVSAQAIQTVGTASQDFSIAAHHFDLAFVLTWDSSRR